MSSIIEGYNYDIFISYRQKDNKGDRWVSKFIEALKTELEATFKEDVSVYFDENPHDRLQETHNVDKSLEGKLNCLIFIPILSQTYCDPNSYAWQYEFLVFNKLAKEDNFGRDIRLRNGNYASRILPIRIHDLEQEDVKLFEKETGSVLRAMDFVFKTSTGVSRPLKVNEDHPQDNLNKTYYSDQINKVAHAIKEIIQGMKAEPVTLGKGKTEQGKLLEEASKDEKMEVQEKTVKTSKRKLLIGSSVIGILLILAAILAYPKIFQRDTLEKLRSSGERISIAVMPFRNLTNDTIWNKWQEVIQNNLSNKLSNSDELRIIQVELINSMIQSNGLINTTAITPSRARKISKILDANIFIYGSVNQSGPTIRLNAQLIDSKTNETFKSFQTDGIAENILHISDSLSTEVNKFLVISKLKKEVISNLLPLASTSSPEAYKFFINGTNAYYKMDYPTAVKLLSQAIAIDSNLTLAAIRLTYAYFNQSMYDQGKKLCIKVYNKREKLPDTEKFWANLSYARWFQSPDDEIIILRQMLEIDDQMPYYFWLLGDIYYRLFKYDKAIPEFKRSLDIYKKLGLKPMWVPNYTYLGYAYHKTGLHDEEKKLYKKAEQDFPDYRTLMFRQAVLFITLGDTVAANRYIEKYISEYKNNPTFELQKALSLASIYSEAGILDKAEEYYLKALSLEPESPNWMNTLAYFLIDKDRNINQGKELIDKALIKSPDNYNYLHTKGWGLYKQGKYKEALEILQKSWDIRREKAIYNHEAWLHLEAAKKAVGSQKNN
jgi:tetratricopeptide (TPR) repeat protein